MEGWASLTAFVIGATLLLVSAILVRNARARVELLAHDLLQSNERTSTVLNSITDSFFSLDSEWRFVDVNNAAQCTIFHKSFADLVGKVYWEMFPVAVGTEFHRRCLEAVECGEPAHFEARLRVVEGAWFEIHAYPLDGRLDVYLRGITERKAAEEKLRRQRELLSAVTDNTDAHLVFLDRDFNFLWVNPAYARACGRSQDEFVGRNHFELYPHEENESIFRRVRDAGEPFAVKEKPFVFADHPEWGTTYWDWTLTPIKDGEDTVCNLVFSLMDVTHDVIARQEIQRLRAEAEHRAAELESFIASMSDGVALFSSAGEVVLANQAARRILGVPADLPLAEIPLHYRLYSLEGEEIPTEQFVSRRALRGETITSARFRVVTTWTEGVISASAAPVLDGEGHVVGAVTIFRDVREQVEFEQRREELYQREHKIADMLQQALIPSGLSSPVPGWDITTRYLPAWLEAEVGGDFYDVFDLGDGKIGVLIGDVAGKGLLAAMRVSAARYSVRSYALLDANPAAVMARVNDALSRDEAPGFAGMVTAFFAVVDTKTGEVVYANGGHEPPMVHRSNHVIEELTVGGPALGIIEEATYEQAFVHLAPEDTLIMVTDGITEARRGAKVWGKDGLLQHLPTICCSGLEGIADGIVHGAKAFSGGKLHDDAAVVVLRVG